MLHLLCCSSLRPTKKRHLSRAICCLAGLLTMSGCSSFGNGKMVQELKNDNERLLAEFRAERDRREKTEQALKQAEVRLAESEKLVARQYQAPGADRVSRLQNNSRLTGVDSNASPSFSSELPGAGRGAPTDLGSTQDDSGFRWHRRMSN